MSAEVPEGIFIDVPLERNTDGTTDGIGIIIAPTDADVAAIQAQVTHHIRRGGGTVQELGQDGTPNEGISEDDSAVPGRTFGLFSAWERQRKAGGWVPRGTMKKSWNDPESPDNLIDLDFGTPDD